MGVSEPPQADFDIEIRDGQAVLHIDRDLDLSCVPAAQAAVDRIVATDVATVCVDLTGAQFIDSSGVAVLLRVMETTAARGGRTIVVTEAPGVLRVFSLLGLERQLVVVADRAAVAQATVD
jgi:anti-sigma B factor antagonist